MSFIAPICTPMLEKPSPWHPFTCLLDKYSSLIVSRIVDPKIIKNFIMCLIKCFLSPKFFYAHVSFLLYFTFLLSFSSHTFCGLVGACMNPGSVSLSSLFIHSLVCQIIYSFLSVRISAKLVSALHVCSTCHTIFSLK